MTLFDELFAAERPTASHVGPRSLLHLGRDGGWPGYHAHPSGLAILVCHRSSSWFVVDHTVADGHKFPVLVHGRAASVEACWRDACVALEAQRDARVAKLDRQLAGVAERYRAWATEHPTAVAS